MMVTLENYPEALPGFTSWSVNITDSNACPRNSEYLQPSNTLDAITHVLSTENTPGMQYTVPLPVLEWAPKPCFKISSIEVRNAVTGGLLAGDLASLVVITPGKLLVTVPENQNDDSSVDLTISYALNDTLGTTFTQDFTIEFLAPDLCLQSEIVGPAGDFQNFFAFGIDEITVDYYNIGLYSTNVSATTDCGPLIYTIDPMCSQYISVAEDLVNSELVFTYEQPRDADLRLGKVQTCSMEVSLEQYPEIMPAYARWSVNITDGAGCPTDSDYFVASTTLDAVVNELIAVNIPGEQYPVPLAKLQWAPQHCFSLASTDITDSSTGLALAGDFANAVDIVGSEIIVTVPAGLTDGDILNIAITYTLNDTSGATFVQDLAIEFAGLDPCEAATIKNSYNFLQDVYLYEIDVNVTDSRILSPFTNDVGACGPMSYTLDIVGAGMYTIEENAAGELELNYTQPDTALLFIDKFTIISLTVTLDEYPDVAPLTVQWEISIMSGPDCPATPTVFEMANFETDVIVYDVTISPIFTYKFPTVTLEPAKCFDIDHYQVVDSFGLVPDWVTTDLEKGTFTIAQYDTDFAGRTVSLNIEAISIINSDSFVAAVDVVQVTFVMGCSATEIVAPGIAPITIESGIVQEFEFETFPDTIAIDAGDQLKCGNRIYELIGAPDIIDVFYTDTKFTVTLDTSNEFENTTYTFDLRVYLEDYETDVEAAIIPITVNVVVPFVEEEIFLDDELLADNTTLIDETGSITNDTTVEETKEEGTTEAETIVLSTEPKPYKEPETFEDIVEILTTPDYVPPSGFVQDPALKVTPKAFMRKITPLGVLQIEFTVPMRGLSANELAVLNKLSNEEDDTAFRRLKTKNPLIDISASGLDGYEVIKFEGTEMHVQLLFSDPLNVSFESSDMLNINFPNTSLFVSQAGVSLSNEYEYNQKPIPKQLPIDEKTISVQESIASASVASATLTGTTMVFSVIMTASLSALLGMIEALQIIVLMPLLKTKMPANVGLFMGELMKIAAFDLVETGTYVEAIFNLEPHDAPEGRNFEAIGYESVYFFSNVGSAILIFIFQLLHTLIVMCVAPMKCVEKSKFFRKFKGNLFWNNWIILVKETYILIAITSMITFKYYFKFDTWGNATQTSFTILFAFLFFMIPTALLCFSCKRFKSLNKKSKLRKYGAFYWNINLNKGRAALSHPASFYLRRLFIAWVIVFGPQNYIFHALSIFITSAIIVFLLSQGYLHNEQRNNELINEVAIWFCMDGFYLLNLCDGKTNFNLGYLVIGMVCLLLAYTFISMGINIFKTAKLFIRKLITNRRYRAWRKANLNVIKKTHKHRMEVFMAKRNPEALERARQQTEEDAFNMDSSDSDLSSISESDNESSYSSSGSSEQNERQPENEYGAVTLTPIGPIAPVDIEAKSVLGVDGKNEDQYDTNAELIKSDSKKSVYENTDKMLNQAEDILSQDQNRAPTNLDFAASQGDQPTYGAPSQAPIRPHILDQKLVEDTNEFERKQLEMLQDIDRPMSKGSKKDVDISSANQSKTSSFYNNRKSAIAAAAVDSLEEEEAVQTKSPNTKRVAKIDGFKHSLASLGLGVQEPKLIENAPNPDDSAQVEAFFRNQRKTLAQKISDSNFVKEPKF